MCQWLLAWSSSSEVVQLRLFSVACLAVQFRGGPPIFIFDCLLVVVQVRGGPANAGNCVVRAKIKVVGQILNLLPILAELLGTFSTNPLI